MDRRVLSRPSEQELRLLCRSLFPCSLCQSCGQGQPCSSPSCLCELENRCKPFLTYYTILTTVFLPDLRASPIIRNHHDLIGIVSHLQRTAYSTRDATRQALVDQHNGTWDTQDPQLDTAIELALRVLTLMGHPRKHPSTRTLEDGTGSLQWRSDQSLTDHIEDTIAQAYSFSVTTKPHSLQSTSINKSLGPKIVKHARLVFRPTSNILDHMRLDNKSGVVEIFHHAAFLKENLRCSKPDGATQTRPDVSLLPRDFLLEILDSIQLVLFTLTDKKSRALLQSLINDHGFDPECLKFDHQSIRTDNESTTQFIHLRTRFDILEDEIRNPAPRDSFEKWLDRRSGACNVMLATLIGVIFAVFLGILGLVVSVFQAWVSYQAWKHPVVS